MEQSLFTYHCSVVTTWCYACHEHISTYYWYEHITRLYYRDNKTTCIYLEQYPDCGQLLRISQHTNPFSLFVVKLPLSISKFLVAARCPDKERHLASYPRTNTNDILICSEDSVSLKTEKGIIIIYFTYSLIKLYLHAFRQYHCSPIQVLIVAN